MVRLNEKKRPDKFLFALILILIFWGIFTTGTVSFPLSLEKFGTPWKYLLQQLSRLLIGVILGYALYKTPIEKIKKYSPHFFLATLFLIFLVFAPKIGISAKGASRWLNFGFFTLQPSEILKLTFILYLSAWLSGRTKRKTRKHEGARLPRNELLLPFIIILIVLFAGLYLQKDLTTLILIACIGLAVYFFGPTAWWNTAVMILLSVVLFSIFVAAEPYRVERIKTYLNPQADPLGSGYQPQQSAVAIGSGKIFGINNGLGLGMSRQKFGFLPESQTDSIFAIIAEEVGFVGCLVLLSLFLLFCWRGLLIAGYFHHDFKGFVAFGISFWIAFQALLNIAGVSGIIPLGGVPLPFFSFGGSHLIAELMACGILLNISKQV